MMPLTAQRRGRLRTLLLFLVVLGVMVAVLAGVAQGTTTTTLQPTAEDQASFSVSARDLGDYDDSAPAIDSPAAIVIDMDSGRVLYEWDAYEQRRMASTTKIMTAILVLENMDLDTKITASKNAANTIEPKYWLYEGDVLTVEEFLYAMMLRSANAAAVALAEGCAGSVEAFADMMNAKAAELGMNDTHFVNPNGLDKDGHYSTAADMAVLARYAMQNEEFRKIVSTEEYTVQIPGRSSTLTFENTNKLLGSVSWVTGIKTGLTPKAEQCLVASAARNDVSVISVVLGQPVSDLCFDESKILLDYGLKQLRHVELLEAGEAIAEAEVPYRLDAKVQLVTETAAELDLYKDDTVTATVVIDRELVLPVRAGDTYGRVELSIDGEVVQTIDLLASASYDKTTLGSKVAYYFKRLGKWLGGLV
jgi:serine-type D-Ala-D-Ala carboxypeptidase (penicillin-binding protein 5/6)